VAPIGTAAPLFLTAPYHRSVVTDTHHLAGALLEQRYQVGELLAVGGMSRVYRGTDVRLDRTVAIKVMDSRLAADPSFRGRLEREARAMARLDHPGVVGVYDQGEHQVGSERLVYLVMEFIDGGTLRDVLLERSKLEPPEAFAVLEPVLTALAVAHRHGMAHRDVKPENVLISKSGAVKVADFGLVTAAANTAATAAGTIMGTVAYLSPEQVVGEGVGPPSDVYAAGVMLFELLTGVPPFSGEHAVSVAYQHINCDVPAPSTLLPWLPPELDGLVARATVRDSRERLPDAETMLSAMRGVRAALGLPTVPAPVPGSAPQPSKSRSGLSDYRTEDRPSPKSTRALTELAQPAPPIVFGHRQRKAVGWVGAVLVFGMLVAVLGWNLGGGSGTRIPVVVDMPQTTAQQAITEAGLTPVVTERHDDRVPAGIVIDSTPAGGSSVRDGSQVTLIVSTGHPRVPMIVPGTPVAAAEDAIRVADLTPAQDGAVHRYHPSAPAGSVIGTTPPAGSELTIGAPVTLVLSRGPEHHDHDDRPSNGIGASIADAITRQLERALGGGRGG